jgi:hypothetical protein
MELKFACASCGQHISATRAQIGVTAPCPNCNAAVTVPKTSTLPHPPPAPRQTEFREKKRHKTTVILIDKSGAAKKETKWTDDPAEARNWLIGRLSEIHAGEYVGGSFDEKMVEAIMPSPTERLGVEVMTSSRARSERDEMRDFLKWMLDNDRVPKGLKALIAEALHRWS